MLSLLRGGNVMHELCLSWKLSASIRTICNIAAKSVFLHSAPILNHSANCAWILAHSAASSQILFANLSAISIVVVVVVVVGLFLYIMMFVTWFVHFPTSCQECSSLSILFLWLLPEEYFCLWIFYIGTIKLTKLDTHTHRLSLFLFY